jgi:hypothetical protein
VGARKIKDLRVRDFQDAEIFKTRNFETLTFWLGGSKQDGPNQFHAGESRANQPGFVASGAAGDFASARPAKGRAAQETLDRLQASQSHLGGLSFWEKLGNVPLFAKTWRKTWKHGETWGNMGGNMGTDGGNMGTDGTYPDYFLPIRESQRQRRAIAVFAPDL